ncbi:MAG: aminodeoxychorismate synthase component I [Thermodesulfobacteriota bacterium]|nr:aminodeoxychorismate synthase component I [Thermodesulfobacteriota bacterium]
MTINDLLENLEKPEQIYTTELSLSEPFMDLAARFAGLPGTVSLMSGGDLDCAQYHILGVAPWFVLTTKDRRITLTRDKDTRTVIDADPLKALSRIISHCRMPVTELPAPIASGLMGYIAYDLKDQLETLPRTCVDDLSLPDIYLTAPQIIVTQDKNTGQTRLHITGLTGKDRTGLMDWFNAMCVKPLDNDSDMHTDGEFRSNTTQADYEQAVSNVIDYIAAGDVYQVNMSQRFETGFSGNPFSLFCNLYTQNPAPFFAYIHAGDHYILSTSPERFIKQADRYIETRPIKGTRPRGKTPAEDEKNRRALMGSKKDDAELSMIVDLLRNDLGRVCKGGSVMVTCHKKLEAYDNVFHMISIIQGELAEGKDAGDILAGVFPGGSITGCPKIRAMEIIDELEPVRRHVYTGAIGYISFHDTMDLSVAIRTAIISDNRLFYAAGGGIVYDSNPRDEFEETLAKADTMLTRFTHARRMGENNRQYVWLNGKIYPASEASVPVDSPGFQYGAGLFETIRVSQGEPQFLEAHVKRLTASWTALFQTPPPDLTWGWVIRQVVDANQLGNGVAAVKIMATHGNRIKPPFTHTLAVTARAYVHRLAQLEKSGLDLVTYPMPRQVETASHKTHNYFFYYRAGQWAKQNNGDEAIILNPDNTISETNTANLLLIKEKTVIVPRSRTVLKGIMQAQVLDCLASRGYKIVNRKTTVAQCLEADEALVTNSLMGIVPVLSIDGKKTGHPTDLARAVNEMVIGPDQSLR